MSSVAPVLVVEDHADTRELVATLLETAGFSVVTADNGLTGLQRLQEARPCVVLLDLTMPVMSGWEFRSAQLQMDGLSGVPVLLMTALPDAERHARALKAAGVIAKPFDYDRLISQVSQHCGEPRE